MSRTNIVVAFCTICALTAFYFYRQNHAIPIPPVAFFISAAAICLMPVLYGLVRHKTCQSKRPAR